MLFQFAFCFVFFGTIFCVKHFGLVRLTFSRHNFNVTAQKIVYDTPLTINCRGIPFRYIVHAIRDQMLMFIFFVDISCYTFPDLNDSPFRIRFICTASLLLIDYLLTFYTERKRTSCEPLCHFHNGTLVYKLVLCDDNNRGLELAVCRISFERFLLFCPISLFFVFFKLAH